MHPLFDDTWVAGCLGSTWTNPAPFLPLAKVPAGSPPCAQVVSGLESNPVTSLAM